MGRNYSENRLGIVKLEIYRERYLTAFTTETLILADLNSKKYSEVKRINKIRSTGRNLVKRSFPLKMRIYV